MAGRAHKVVTSKRGNLLFQALVIVDQGSEKNNVDPLSRFQLKGRVPPQGTGQQRGDQKSVDTLVGLCVEATLQSYLRSLHNHS